jgi:hypothetical protein
MKPTMVVTPNRRITSTCCSERVSRPVPADRKIALVKCSTASRM